jgi:hypothetical protein
MVKLETSFLFAFTITVLIVFAIVTRYKTPDIRHLIIGITSIAYSMTYDIIFGDIFELYYYIDLRYSTLYMVIEGILLYPALNIIYTLFLPQRLSNTLYYTIYWIAGVFLLEHITILTRTIVLTGWNVLPWSILTYIVTFLWINLLYRYLTGKFHSTSEVL